MKFREVPKTLLLCLTFISAVFSIPTFDPTALLQQALIPADAAVNSIIYRLRAYDPTIDYPLIFTLENEPTIVSLETIECTRLNSICQANVVLKKRLEPERFYDFVVVVQNQKGESTKLNCSFKATNATTPINEIFPGAPSVLMVSENARRNTELGIIRAKGNPSKGDGVVMELWGAPQFGIHQKLINSRDAQATIILIGPLDYETTNVHHLTILANDPWTVTNEDTRNIASWSFLVGVIDVQDTPPIFTIAPPTTSLSPNLLPGDTILRVHAEDGDRGKPRNITYGLVPEGNPFTTFFNISEDTGELRLVRPLSEISAISHSGQPILLTVIAEEIRTNPNEPPAQSTAVSLALIPPGIPAGTPIFGSNEYNTLLDENSPVGTILELPQAEVVAQPGNVVALSLDGNNGTFEITPNVVEGQSKFEIRVHDPRLLDYEKWHSVECLIVAREVGLGNFTTKARLEVLLNDVNDNPPQFSEDEYKATIQENAPVGTTVVRVEATDIDREPGSKIRYTRLSGLGSNLFNLDPATGVITVTNSKGLDADKTPIVSLLVEATDEDGRGQTSTSTVTISLSDINDEVPQFERDVYEFILNQDKTAFTTRAFIKAVDKDLSPPNNQVHYELIKTVENLHLNEDTGELVVIQTWTENKIVTTTARVWDGGIPRLSSQCEIRIYPPESQSRRMVFIVPGKNPDLGELQKKLSVLTGAKITINEVRPYTGAEPGAKDVSSSSGSDKSVVVVTATYSDDVIDVNTVRQIFDEKHATTIQIATASKPGGNLLWLLILLIVLALLLILILILCCICQGCPLYVPPKRRRVVSAEIKKVVQGSGFGKESKSVQVAEWFGRREAWTPEHVLVDNEAESLQRHEQERGSDRTEVRRVHRQLQREPSRDQLYIREGNTDILRLVTRGNDQRTDHYYVTDSGKDILMRRFIDQQTETSRQVHLPNAVAKLQTEHELLEASLRQQNALLRQILMERERDLRLETQSLPAGTQTDQDRETQTEPLFLRPPRRRVRSDNDASEGSDDEAAMVRARARRRRTHLRKLKTPIQEESEVEEKPAKKTSAQPRVHIRHTKTSELRQKKASATSTKSRNNIKKEVLKEISASLQSESNSEEEVEQKEKSVRKNEREYFSDDSLEEISPRSEKTTDSSKQKYHSTDSSKQKYHSADSSKQKYHSESDLRLPLALTKETKAESQLQFSERQMSQSHTDLTVKSEEKTKSKKKKPAKRTARYMEWYNKNSKTSTTKDTEDTKSTKSDKPDKPDKPLTKEEKAIKETAKKVTSRLMQDTESSARKKVDSKKLAAGPDHPLLQHSEHRFEAQYPIARKPEEDTDSGIALARLPIAQKKSVFTIAYDDMHTSQLRPDSHSPPL